MWEVLFYSTVQIEICCAADQSGKLFMQEIESLHIYSNFLGGAGKLFIVCQEDRCILDETISLALMETPKCISQDWSCRSRDSIRGDHWYSLFPSRLRSTRTTGHQLWLHRSYCRQA